MSDERNSPLSQFKAFVSDILTVRKSDLDRAESQFALGLPGTKDDDDGYNEE